MIPAKNNLPRTTVTTTVKTDRATKLSIIFVITVGVGTLLLSLLALLSRWLNRG